jgi:hypothetical protein
VSATFKVTSGPAAFNGDLVGNASWTTTSGTQSETTAEKVRNVSPIKINEFAVNSTDSFIEFYNAGNSDVDISNWTLTQHATQQPIFSSVKIPAGTKLATKGFYLLGLANSGLAVPAQKGDTTIHVRSTAGMKAGDTIEIDTGSAVETRKIANLGTAAGNSTTLWQPLPDGPVITIPPGSTNVPFTGTGGGFTVEVGQKIGIGCGATYPTVAKDVEKYEVVTVTAVGKPGTQTRLAADAKAGDTTIKLGAGNISVGDRITLDIDSVGHGIEIVTVKSLGGGEGLELEAPLKFNHAKNLPISVRGTGISFQPATAFAHSSNEPIQPLGTGITLDSTLANDHAINAVVRDAAVTTAGYQGTPAPNQWFGGPALSPVAGSMVLRDSDGLVADSLNYGHLVDPWAAEGYQAGQKVCCAPAPGTGKGGLGGGSPRSVGRFPDGADTGDNSTDFLLQTSITLSADSAAGATNIKVASVAGFRARQTITIDTGANRETAEIATVGAPGATTVGTATALGATVIPVASATDFNAGQTITIDSGANLETAVVASVGGGKARKGWPVAITVNAPLKIAHAAGAQVSGTGITLTTALTKTHAIGAQVGSLGPTPGAPNQSPRGP